MDDKLQPIRRLYGEAPEPGATGGEGMPPEAEAEMRALAPVKRALERLPRSSADPSALATINAAAGAHSVRHLYGESPPQPLSAGAELEARALAPVMDALNALPPQKPDAAVLASVLAAATASAHRTDRAAVVPTRARRRRPAVLLGGLFALFLIASTLVWISQDTERADVTADATGNAVEAPQPDIAAEPEPAVAAPDQVAEASPTRAVAPPSTDEAAGRAPAEPTASTAPPSSPPAGVAPSPRVMTTALAGADFIAADAETDGTALKLLYLRLDALQDDDLGWDGPAEILGESRSTPAGRPSGHGWMQVRVDR